jgi:transposase
MVAATATMPDLDTLQPDALKAIIAAQQLQLLSNDNEIEHLKLLVAKLRRMQFGRRSEKVTRQIERTPPGKSILFADFGK